MKLHFVIFVVMWSCTFCSKLDPHSAGPASQEHPIRVAYRFKILPTSLLAAEVSTNRVFIFFQPKSTYGVCILLGMANAFSPEKFPLQNGWHRAPTGEYYKNRWKCPWKLTLSTYLPLVFCRFVETCCMLVKRGWWDWSSVIVLTWSTACSMHFVRIFFDSVHVFPKLGHFLQSFCSELMLDHLFWEMLDDLGWLGMFF